MTVRILVVDDHPVVRHGLRTLLGAHPEWEIIDEAADGFEAVDKADRLKPDVVVLDITMPKMSGLEACRLIRKIHAAGGDFNGHAARFSAHDARSHGSGSPWLCGEVKCVAGSVGRGRSCKPAYAVHSFKPAFR